MAEITQKSSNITQWATCWWLMQCNDSEHVTIFITRSCIPLQKFLLFRQAKIPLFYCKRNVRIEIHVSAHQWESKFALMMFYAELLFCEYQFNFLDSYQLSHKAQTHSFIPVQQVQQTLVQLLAAIDNSLKVRSFLKCDWCSPYQWQGINSEVDFRSRISNFPPDIIYFRQTICKLGRFSLWVSAAEFPPDYDNPKLSRHCFYDSVRHLTLPAADTLACGM